MSTLKKHLLFLVAVLCLHQSQAQEKRFTITTGEHGLLSIPLRMAISDFSPNNDTLAIKVFREYDDKKILLKSQVQQGDQTMLWFVPDEPIGPETTADFVLEIIQGSQELVESESISMDDKNISLLSDHQPVLDYRYAFQEAPDTAHPIFGKSGFIHPLYSPKGNVLTRIQPNDHYHHYGIWNPWTKTKIKGKEVDFWNLLENQGTVRYGGIISKTSGSVFSGFKLKQEHVTFQDNVSDSVAINETWEVRSYPVVIEDRTCWLIDMTISLNNNLDSKIELTNYRYGGGIGFRATKDWTNQNSKVLTSEGKTRIDADGTSAKWCKVEGKFPTGINSGIVFFSHPDNRAHPEPMRVWPVDANDGRGDVFFEFCPIRHQKWDLYPDKVYVLKYRMLVFDDELSAEVAESVWQSFAKEIQVDWK